MVKQKTKADSVENQLRALHQLQVIDSKIDNIRIVRGELPLEISDLQDTIAGLNLRLDKIQSEIDDINDNIVGNKNTISLAVAAVEKYEEQLKNIKNNREYTSLTKEVEYQNLEIELANKKKTQNDEIYILIATFYSKDTASFLKILQASFYNTRFLILLPNHQILPLQFFLDYESLF